MLFLRMTVLENITLEPLGVHRVPHGQAGERAGELLARLALADKAASPRTDSAATSGNEPRS